MIIFVSGKIYCAPMLQLCSPDTPLVSLMSSINLSASSNSSCPLCLFPVCCSTRLWEFADRLFFFRLIGSALCLSPLTSGSVSPRAICCGLVAPSLTDPRYTLHSLVFSPRHTPRTPADFVPDLAVVECDLVKIIPPFSWENKDKEISRVIAD